MSAGEINVGITADASEFESQIEAAKTAVESLSQSISPATTELDNLSQSFTTVGGSADTLGQSTDSLSTSLGNVPSAITDVASGADTLAQSTEAAATGADTLATSADAVGTGMGTLGQNFDTAAASATTFATESDNLGLSVDTLSGASDTLNQSVADTGSVLSETGSATSELGSASEDATSGVDSLAQSEDTVGTSLENTNTSLLATADSTNELGTNTEEATTALEDFNTKSEETNDTQLSLSQNIGLVATSFTALATAALGTYTSYRQMQMQATNLEGRQKRYEGQVLKLAKAEKDLEEQYDDNEISSEEYAEKKAILANRAEYLANMETRLGQSEEKLGWAHTRFYLSLLPTAIGIVGSLATVWGTFGKSITGLIPTIGGMSGGFGSLLGVLGPVAIAIAAVAAAYLALKTNFMGVTDGLLAFGKSLGDLLPSLKPVLGMIAGLGAAIGIEFKDSEKWKQYLFDNLGAIGEFLYNFVNHTLRLVVTDVSSWIGEMAAAFQRGDAGEAARLFVEGIGKGITGLQNFGKDYIAPFVQGIINFFTQEVGPKLPELGKLIVEGIGGAIKWTSDAVSKLWGGFVQAGKDFFNTDKLSDLEKTFISTVAAWTGFKEEDLITQWNTFWEALNGLFSRPPAESAKTIMTNIGKAFEFTVDTLAPLVTSFWDQMTSLLPAPENAKAAGEAVANAIVGAIKTAGSILAAVGEFIWASITGAEISGDTQSKIKTAVNAFLGFVKQALTDVGAFFVGIGEGLWKAIEPEVTKAFAGAQATITKWGTDFITWIWDGILGGVQYFKELVNSIWAWIKEGAGTLWTNLNTLGKNIINEIVTGLTNAAQPIKDFLATIWGWIKEGAAQLWKDLNTLGANIITEITTPITEAKENFQKTFTDLFDGIWEKIKPFVQPILDFINTITSFKLPDWLGGGGGSGAAVRELGFGELDRSINERLAMYEVQGFRTRNPAKSSLTQNAELDQGALEAMMLFDPEALMEQITQLITKLQELGIALQSNSTIWQAWANGITSMIAAFAELWVAFVNETLVANMMLIGVTLQSTSLIWQAWFDGNAAMLAAFAELWVAFVNETLVANLMLIGVAIQSNSIVWQAYFEGLGAMIAALAELWVAFIDETMIANITLLGETVAANAVVWQAYFDGNAAMIAAFAELWVAFIDETMVANLVLLTTELTKNKDEGWTPWIEYVTEAIALLAKVLAEFIDNVFTVFTDEIVGGLEEQEEAWLSWAERAGGALVLIGEAIAELYDNVFTPWVDGTIQSLDEMMTAWQDLAEAVVEAIDEMVASLDDLVSGLEDVTTAAEDATDALHEMEQAANDAAEAASRVGGARYGGSWIAGAGFRFGGGFLSNKRGFASGGSFINTQERMFKGRKISELDKWELVTVIPLSNPQIAGDKNSLLNAPIQMPSATSMGIGGGGRATAGRGGNITFTGNINNTLVMPDGRVIAQISNPYLLEGQDADL